VSTEQTFTITFLGETAVHGIRNRLAETDQPTIEGAQAALETFYYALNERSINVFRQIWLDDPLIQLDNPVGGILRGAQPIIDLYARVFKGSVRVQEFYDIVVYASSEAVVFAGRERGTYEQGGSTCPLDIRTSRIFAYVPAQGGWRQVHHHGSIDDAARLSHYQRAILGA
jgi:hypothetical protein